MGREMLSLLCTVLMFLLCASAMMDAHATDKATLFELRRLSELVPSQHWVIRAEVRDYLAKRRYDADGNEVEIGKDYDNYALGPYTTHFDSSLHGQRYRLLLAYGVSDRLSMGVMLPYGTMNQSVDFSATSAGGDATENVQQLLAHYGYKRVATTQTTGLMDPILGTRWLVYSGSRDALVVGPGVRVGLSKKDDPDNLVDVRWDDGSTDLLFDVGYTRLLDYGLDARLQGRFADQRPDHVRARAFSTTESLVPASRTERLSRDLGSLFEGGVELGYSVGYWRYNLTWDLMRKSADRYRSPRGQDVSGLEKDTARSADAIRVGATWLGARATFGVPVFLEIQYREPVRRTNTSISRDYYLLITSLM